MPTKILTPIGILGYGYPVQDFWGCIEAGVDAIVVDSGSTDPGPYMLGLDSQLVSDESFGRDLRPMLQAANLHKIPVFIGSAGGAGTRHQVDSMVALVDKIATEEGFGLNVAAVYAEVPRSVAVERMAAGQLRANVRGELPSVDDIEGTEALVAQMGSEPFTEIIESGEQVDVVVAGRAYDPSPHGVGHQPGRQPGHRLAHGQDPGVRRRLL